jgi:type 1 fimbria pilin
LGVSPLVLAGTLTFPGTGAASLALPFPATMSTPRDAVVGTLFSPFASSNAGMATSSITCPVTRTTRVNGILVPGTTNVYQTNLSGVGVQFRQTEGWNGGWEVVPTTETFTPPTSGGSQNYVRADLVVTGTVQSGALTTLPTMTESFTGSCFSSVSATFTISPGTTVTATTCTVTSSPSVKLPPVTVNQLLPVGSTAGSTNFSIGLSCRSVVNVYITLTDATNPANRTNTLTLAPASTAHGVGVQILHSGVPAVFGPDSSVANTPGQWLVGPSANINGVQLTAQYVSTGPVSGGSVSALATFTMSYQ